MVVAKATKEALRLKDLVKELCIQQGGVQLHYGQGGDCCSLLFISRCWSGVYQAKQNDDIFLSRIYFLFCF
jgi:hypothetical protein